MALKLLSNVTNEGVQHIAGEILDIVDKQLAASLVTRGLAAPASSPATHVWGERSVSGASSRGGKTVDEKATETTATNNAEEAIANPPAEEQTNTPETNAPTPNETPSSKSGLMDKLKGKTVDTAPSAEDIAKDPQLQNQN